uniref:hypothetical protein n=1 Tax=Streptomyces sp. W9 TaxID=682410 RepID=UPI0018674662|nr:hypothetical protein [Streptomyces sp. W9]
MPLNAEIRSAYRAAQEELIILPSWDADRVRAYLKEAVRTQTGEPLRREGHTWSGAIALRLFDLADAIDRAAGLEPQA